MLQCTARHPRPCGQPCLSPVGHKVIAETNQKDMKVRWGPGRGDGRRGEVWVDCEQSEFYIAMRLSKNKLVQIIKH